LTDNISGAVNIKPLTRGLFGWRVVGAREGFFPRARIAVGINERNHPGWDLDPGVYLADNDGARGRWPPRPAPALPRQPSLAARCGPASQRGVVQAALSRDHEVSACDGVLEALFGRHQVEPPDDLAPQRR
jgi:hypothetical protein